jgi:NAD(P)-dependent dehydrogenase (short-subunit alcohol dehydrogenase family)
LNAHIIVGGGSGIGAILSKLIFKDTNDNIMVFDKYFQEKEFDNRVSHVNIKVTADLNLSSHIKKFLALNLYRLFLPAVGSRDPIRNDIGFTENYVENIGAIHFSLLRLLECAWEKFVVPSSVVLVSSILGTRVSLVDSTLDYHSSKAVLDSIVRYMSIRLAPNTVVNGIAPGLIARHENSVLLMDNHLSETIKKAVPLQRPCTQVEVAKAIWTLASGLFSYLNGQIILLDGDSSLIESYSLLRSP